MHKDEHVVRMNKVINYIQHNLDQDLSLQVLAEQAAFSPYHFHRIFKQVVGIPVNAYVRREKIERAAKMLVHNLNTELTSIALDSGFSSVSTFSRAFKERFGMSATQYREQYIASPNSKICKTDSKDWQAISPAERYDTYTAAAAESIIQRGFESMNVIVKKLPDLRVAYVRVYEGYEPSELSASIDAAFNKVCGWVGARELYAPETMVLGMFFDDNLVTSSSNRRYDAAVTVPGEVLTGTDGIDIQEIPTGQYASCRVEVDSSLPGAMGQAVQQVDHAFKHILQDWLPTSAFQLVDQPMLEWYVSGQETLTIVIEALIPIAPK
ncbi:helix-turn-helix domain-containing protein [Paenibacillus sp. N1-5-1-14]|uniref:AraC family transcriptional regulator n=1 Tax=Paenibacillus radicibacter TaxID=2972488 RepID=UPI002158BD58|nr:helix-turn-helix domain-containing protein [Paenibacillus radicibacter]MCR8643094.1 helix-turn-helix domain-containing protein [Paenibacillus radicibacter]